MNDSKEKPEGKGAHLVSNVKFPRSVEVEDGVERPGVPFIKVIIFQQRLSIFTRVAVDKDHNYSS